MNTSSKSAARSTSYEQATLASSAGVNGIQPFTISKNFIDLRLMDKPWILPSSVVLHVGQYIVYQLPGLDRSMLTLSCAGHYSSVEQSRRGQMFYPCLYHRRHRNQDTCSSAPSLTPHIQTHSPDASCYKTPCRLRHVYVRP